jgi:dTMP kinase
MSGLFVAFEGGEGSGKSTQARLLADALTAAGRDVVLTREPGATTVGARLRELLLDPAARIDGRAEALLYAADRAQHVAEVVAPALARGAVVVSDRYAGSSLAYQGGGRRLDAAGVRGLSEFATGGLWPDHTVLLDVDPRVGLARAGGVGDPDRLESEDLAFHDRVRACFLALAADADPAWLVVDAAGEPDAVHRRILDGVLGPAGTG